MYKHKLIRIILYTFILFMGVYPIAPVLSLTAPPPGSSNPDGSDLPEEALTIEVSDYAQFKRAVISLPQTGGTIQLTHDLIMPQEETWEITVFKPINVDMGSFSFIIKGHFILASNPRAPMLFTGDGQSQPLIQISETGYLEISGVRVSTEGSYGILQEEGAFFCSR